MTAAEMTMTFAHLPPSEAAELLEAACVGLMDQFDPESIPLTTVGALMQAHVSIIELRKALATKEVL